MGILFRPQFCRAQTHPCVLLTPHLRMYHNDAFSHHQRASTHCQDQGSNSINIYISDSWLCSCLQSQRLDSLLPSQGGGNKTCKQLQISSLY